MGRLGKSMKDSSKSIARTLGFGSVVKEVNKSPPPPPAAIPLPDEEELARIRRKRAAQRGGGRASTQLASDINSDTFGP